MFPRLIAAEHRGGHVMRRSCRRSVPELDDLLGGGIEEGTSTLIVGGAGTGKSTIAAQFCAAAAQRGQKSIVFMFDESPNTLFTRCRGLGIELEEQVTAGLITLVQVDPAELSPGELAFHDSRGGREATASRSSSSTVSTAISTRCPRSASSSSSSTSC